MIGVVYDGVVERGEVDACGLFGGVSHSCANNRQGDIVIACCRCPAMARGVGGKFALSAEHFGEFVEHSVVGTECAHILLVGRCNIRGGQHGE